MHDTVATVTNVFGASPRVQILTVLTLADEELNMSEILSRCDVSNGGFYNNIDHLLDENLVLQPRTLGNVKLYTINHDHDVIPAFKTFLETLD